MPSLVDLPSPSARFEYPPCAATCSDIITANVACATATAVNKCFCDQLSFPTACGGACIRNEERTSVAKWYWDICPSAMDSRLSEIAKTELVAEWAVQTPRGAKWTTAVHCYYAGNCGAPIPTVPTPTAATSNSPSTKPKIKITLILAILLPLFLAFTIGFLIYFIWHRTRRQAGKKRACEERHEQEKRQLDDRLKEEQKHLHRRLQEQRMQKDLQDQKLLQLLQELTYRLTTASQVTSDAANERLQNMENTVQRLGKLVAQLEDERNSGTANIEAFAMELGNALTCPICFEIFKDPMCVLTPDTYVDEGCLHTFCAACISEVLETDRRCPFDRRPITAVNKYRLMADIVAIFEGQFPDWQKEDSAGMES